jgi:hypothetical protein
MQTGFTDEPPHPEGPAVVTAADYVLTPEDHVACRMFLLDRQLAQPPANGGAAAGCTLAAMGLVCFFAMLAYFLGRGQAAAAVVWVAGAGAFVFLILRIRSARVPQRPPGEESAARRRHADMYRAEGELYAGRRDRVELTADGFVESNESYEDDRGVEVVERKQTRVHWLSVERIDLLENYAVFTVAEKGHLFVPKRAFADDAAFQAFADTAERLRREAVHRATGAFTTALSRSDAVRPAK